MKPDLLSKEELPAWFEYPAEFQRLIDSEIFLIEPWQILEGKWLRARYNGLKERFPKRNLVPFFRCLASDDVACWEKDKPGKVVIVHDFASPGWEESDDFNTFWDWFRSTLETFMDHE